MIFIQCYYKISVDVTTSSQSFYDTSQIDAKLLKLCLADYFDLVTQQFDHHINSNFKF